MRRRFVVLVAGALLLGCSGGSPSRSAVTTTLPANVVNDGTARAAIVVDELKKAGAPIGMSVAHPPGDDVFADHDGLTGKVDFRDERLLSTSSDIDETLDGGSVEVYRDAKAALAASKNRAGYVFVSGAVLLHLAGELAPEWAIGYRDALRHLAP